MKPSFLKFLIFQKQSNLNPLKIETLHDLLFLSPLKHKINSEKLKRKLDLPTKVAEKVYIDLVKNEVINVEPINCQNCKDVIAKFEKSCSNCNEEIDISEFYTNINALLDERKSQLIKDKYQESKKADIIAREWEKQKYLSYVLIDLVDSENIQNKLGDQDFKIFFEEIRDLLKYHTLNNTKGEYLILGEIGDCIKITFTKKEDVLTFFKNFSKELRFRVENSEIIKKHISELSYFPKFSGIVDILELPSTSSGNISARSIVSITLDGSIDFNSKALTSLFRLDSGVSINNEKTFTNNNLSLWLSENFINETKLSILNKTEVTVGKHEYLKVKRNVALILFNDGNEYPIDNPSQYIK